ncbi:thioesterase family protein [Spirulina sp. CS-785/01]|uniref:acyl-CoA thioesterase n=1 Tax=Spirulina sp. CS-785/01 TaxID=3021716 RepID=UPI00232F2BC5|nr:thioesterase family protein [Spirulina sp. CS-785/01]MDB9312939.1 thioesterase family protein [Spirulina sp. CS-785/01]
MSFVYERTIRLRDTDAAGVVYFTQFLQFCHEAYEESLLEFGVNVQQLVAPQGIALPLVETSGKFFRPLFAGDRIIIELIPQSEKETEFKITYRLFLGEDTLKPIATAMTRHVCINGETRNREPLPQLIQDWLTQSLQ